MWRVSGILAADSAWNELPSRAQRLDVRLQEYRLTSCREKMRQRFSQLWPGSGNLTAPMDVAEWQRFWDEMGARRFSSSALNDYLDRVTTEFLEAVTVAWPLHDLVSTLDGASGHDLLVQVDDVLFSVPIAFLRHEGRYLFEQVRSMHVVLSLSLVEWLQQVDCRAFQNGWNKPDKILSLSWFRPEDSGPRKGAVLLHQGQQDLAKASAACQWYTRADHPAGTHACLARGLHVHQDFRVVSICGHGNSDRAGIELGDGVWDGSSLWRKSGDSWRHRQACDLRGIELLIQVSCSIGRVRQAGLQDVEGFCVELAVHRARSVLAGLWPLHSLAGSEVR